jgi:polyhydroxyalkanoate synthase
MSKQEGRAGAAGGKSRSTASGPGAAGVPDPPKSDAPTADPTTADPGEASRQMADRMAEIARKSQRLVSDFLGRLGEQAGSPAGGPAGGPAGADEDIGLSNPAAIGAAFLEMTQRMMADPARLIEAQVSLWNDYARLWQHTARRFLGGAAEPAIEAAPEDRRFRDRAWSDNALFDFIKQSYLLTARWVQGAVSNVEGLDERTARKVDFYTRQFVDAIAPSNFVLTNPEVLRATIESRGENLVNGLKNLLGDLEAARAASRSA